MTNEPAPLPPKYPNWNLWYVIVLFFFDMNIYVYLIFAKQIVEFCLEFEIKQELGIRAESLIKKEHLSKKESVEFKEDVEKFLKISTKFKGYINITTGVFALIFFILSCLLTDHRYKDLENKSSKVHTYRRILITQFLVVCLVVAISCIFLNELRKEAPNRRFNR